MDSPVTSPRRKPPLGPRHWIAFALGVAGLVALFIMLSRGPGSKMFTPAPPPVIVTTATVQSGDVFGVILTKRLGLDPKYVSPIQKAFRTQLRPESIQPGTNIEVITSTSGVFQKLSYIIDAAHSYVVTRSSIDVYDAQAFAAQTVWMEKRVSVDVSRILEMDLRAAGYDPTLVDNLVSELGDRIFGWRIDFFTEQRKGDKLDVLLEQQYIVGQDHPIKGGRFMRVIAASYTGSGTKNKENYAIRFEPPGAKSAEFYDPDGKAMRRAFLRAPFTRGAFRISSGFNQHRFHPILRIYRPHHGTDYAAAIGTPVAAIGSGRVVRAEWFKGYGNCVDVQHNGKYTSRYGHLSKIAVHRGESIAQGQYLGRVGNTGLSTGPHLHFEMLVNGTQQNFLRMNFPAASSVDNADMPAFIRVRDEAMARLKGRPVDQPKQLTMNVNKQ